MRLETTYETYSQDKTKISNYVRENNLTFVTEKF